MPEVKWEHKLPDQARVLQQTEYNHFGTFTLNDDGTIKTRSDSKGSCHYSLNSLIQSGGSIAKSERYFWISTTYNQYWQLTYEQMEEWFKFTLDPKTSPWGMLLKELEYSVVRNNDGHMVSLVMKVPDLNTTALFHLFKGIRGIRESRALPFFLAKQMGITDPEHLYKIYVLSSYFSVNVSNKVEDSTFLLSFGHDHQPFKKRLNKNLLKRRMICDLRDPNRSLLNTGFYYGTDDMGHHVFGGVNFPSGQQQAYYLSGTSPLHNRIREEIVEGKKIEKSKREVGYFIDIKERHAEQANANLYYIDMKHMTEKTDLLWEILS